MDFMDLMPPLPNNNNSTFNGKTGNWIQLLGYWLKTYPIFTEVSTMVLIHVWYFSVWSLLTRIFSAAPTEYFVLRLGSCYTGCCVTPITKKTRFSLVQSALSFLLIGREKTFCQRNKKFCVDELFFSLTICCRWNKTNLQSCRSRSAGRRRN
jgi:hypothetical protein